MPAGSLEQLVRVQGRDPAPPDEKGALPYCELGGREWGMQLLVVVFESSYRVVAGLEGRGIQETDM